MALSPLMEQYFQIKEKHKDCILFFRLGDFYEMFFDDALTASSELEITLTGRDCGMEERAPMCGVPVFAAQNYIDKLITKGFSVAICEQLEEASAARGLVLRDVIRVVTPGTVTAGDTLDGKQNNYLGSIYKDEWGGVSLAMVDITTGELFATEFSEEVASYRLLSELARYLPREVILSPNASADDTYMSIMKKKIGASIAWVEDEHYGQEASRVAVERQFGADSPIKDRELTLRAVSALLAYLQKTQMMSLPHINMVRFYDENQYVDIDYSTNRNLELHRSMRDSQKKGSLLWVLDKTKTSMGGRKLKNWLCKPLLNIAEIDQRLNTVEELVNHTVERGEIRDLLDGVQDLERLLSKAVTGSANPRDLFALEASLDVMPQIYELLRTFHSSRMVQYVNAFDTLADLADLIHRAIKDNPPATAKEGDVIREGFSEQVDKNRKAMSEGTQWIAKMEQEEREKTGIKNLKIKFNRVTGYYIEVSKVNTKLVPEHYARKQTMANCERYETGELKEIENVIIGAQERNCQQEYSLFCEVRDSVAAESGRVLGMARIIAEIDVLASFAEVAVEHNYTRPRMTPGDEINIKNGRHPVVEAMLTDTLFVPNDTVLNKESRLSIITGPNMAGKSTYMRQVALISLMAQIGCFIPASSAELCIVDKIFTRVGASDDLASGQSTFMVEMNEVANILDNATDRSLLILDEIGRGTSTYDGLSIAWAVVEYIASKKKLGAKTLFATHYHELTELEGKVEGVVNYCIAAKKRGDDIVFLRKIIRGGADDSYGIEVALLAGVKREVIKRARQIVERLESQDINKSSLVDLKDIPTKDARVPKDDGQIGLWSAGEIVERLKRLDPTVITPVESLNILYELKKEAEKV